MVHQAPALLFAYNFYEVYDDTMSKMEYTACPTGTMDFTEKDLEKLHIPSLEDLGGSENRSGLIGSWQKSIDNLSNYANPSSVPSQLPKDSVITSAKVAINGAESILGSIEGLQAQGSCKIPDSYDLSKTKKRIGQFLSHAATLVSKLAEGAATFGELPSIRAQFLYREYKSDVHNKKDLVWARKLIKEVYSEVAGIIQDVMKIVESGSQTIESAKIKNLEEIFIHAYKALDVLIKEDIEFVKKGQITVDEAQPANKRAVIQDVQGKIAKLGIRLVSLN